MVWIPESNSIFSNFEIPFKSQLAAVKEDTFSYTVSEKESGILTQKEKKILLLMNICW